VIASVTKFVPKGALKPKSINCLVDGVATTIPVTAELSARYQELFYRELPSDLQKRRLKTLKRLMEAAYKAGHASNEDTTQLSP
jgi:hypothetical protein